MTALAQTPYSAPSFDLGPTMPGIDIDRIAEALEFLEGPQSPKQRYGIVPIYREHAPSH
jgi:hypothetical protein